MSSPKFNNATVVGCFAVLFGGVSISIQLLTFSNTQYFIMLRKQSDAVKIVTKYGRNSQTDQMVTKNIIRI